MSTKTSHFKTTGMHCPSCAMLIEMTLKKENGVESAEADYIKGMTDVTYDPDLIAAHAITAKIKDLGYTAEETS